MGVTIRSLFLLILGVGLMAFWIGSGRADGDAVLPMPAGKLYLNECGGCHTAYAPGFLPARSWKKMLGDLANHFGEDASLDDAQLGAIEKAILPLAADTPSATLLMRRIASGIGPTEAPQRISGSPYFKYMHDEVPSSFWKRAKIGSPANCAACHTRTSEGRYFEREVSIPK
ncbi:MAG: diheme cytochrome c [Hydrogenophilales bacterium]|nr:diheme cytochrome c [Hydrogenophilales bacterium]